MSQRIFQVLVPLCLLAILVCGSPRIYPSDQQTRDRRHDCSSCRRERPEALASWYAPSAKREYAGLEPEVPRWPSNRPFQPNPSFYPSPYNVYGGAPRGRGGPGIVSLRGVAHPPGTYIREEPFNFHQRDLGFDVAAPPAALVRGVGAPSIPYQPRIPVTRSLGRSPYQSSSFYDVIKRESGPEDNDRYTGFDLSGDEAPEDVHGSSRVYEDPKKKLPVVYRADKYADDSLDQGNPNAPAEEYFRRQAPEHYSRRHAPEQYPTMQAPEQYSRRQAPGQYFRRQAPEGRTPAGQLAEEGERFQQPRKEEYLASLVAQEPEIKREPHHWVPERNIMKIMQNAGKEGLAVTNGSAWQDQNGQELDGSPREAAKTDGQKHARDVNVLNDGAQSDEEKDGSQELGDAVQGYGNVERSKKSTILTPATEITDREPANMWKTVKPILEISTEPFTLP
ncbi:uncharacterized protein LOC143376814 [Andrena cerasifolii]|uniref:uncharacterized protein LOC143376814 n=1 Tax=Andrena cerasifolii TaxID=2819439 RepID=UPI004037F769